MKSSIKFPIPEDEERVNRGTFDYAKEILLNRNFATDCLTMSKLVVTVFVRRMLKHLKRLLKCKHNSLSVLISNFFFLSLTN